VDAIEGVGEVEVSAKREGRDVVLSVRDNGPGPVANQRSSNGGVGLRNTVARLTQLYGPGQRFELRGVTGGGTVARLRIPFHTDVAT
ncbi:MAG TPA: hypothetical protein VGM50_01415, partial [Gemmatimonadaceae bacterium]